MHWFIVGWVTVIWNYSVLTRLPWSIFQQLQSVLNSAARLIFGLKRCDHITNALLMDLHWLPYPQRITYKLCMIMFKSLRGSSLAYLAYYCTSTSLVPGPTWRSVSLPGDKITLDLPPPPPSPNHPSSQKVIGFAGISWVIPGGVKGARAPSHQWLRHCKSIIGVWNPSVCVLVERQINKLHTFCYIRRILDVHAVTQPKFDL